MNRTSLLFFGLGLLFSHFSFSAVTVTDLKNSRKLDSQLFKSQEGFVALDSINVVYGAELVFSESLKLTGSNRVIGADSPEEDLTYLNTTTEISASEGKEGSAASPVGVVAIRTPINAGEFRVVTGSSKTVIKDEQGVDWLLIEWQSEKTGMLYGQCPEELLRLREARNSQISQPIGVYCNFSRSPGLVTVSLGKESRWLSSNLVEVSGKGERFRTFEIPVGNLKGEASGVLRFVIAGQALNYSVFVKKLDEKTESFFIPFEKTVSFGMASNALSAPGNSYSSSSFYYEFNGLTEHIFKYFKLGFGFFNSFAMSEDPTLISSRDSKVTLGYYSAKTSALNWGAWLGHRNFDYKQDLSMTKFQSSQFGFGGHAQYDFSKGKRLIGYLEMASFGSKVVSSHMKFGVHYKHSLSFSKRLMILGALFESQTMSVQTSAGDSRDLASTKMGVSLDF